MSTEADDVQFCLRRTVLDLLMTVFGAVGFCLNRTFFRRYDVVREPFPSEAVRLDLPAWFASVQA
jgi:hypothetical protein